MRDIHRNCQKALKEHVTLEPVIAGKQEGETVEVPKGFDPSAIRLTGNVTGEPPFKGALQHHGWRVKEVKLQRPPEGQDAFVIQVAEVELAKPRITRMARVMTGQPIRGIRGIRG